MLCPSHLVGNVRTKCSLVPGWEPGAEKHTWERWGEGIGIRTQHGLELLAAYQHWLLPRDQCTALTEDAKAGGGARVHRETVNDALNLKLVHNLKLIRK